jgi:hypothetical protein
MCLNGLILSASLALTNTPPRGVPQLDHIGIAIPLEVG